MFIHFDYANGAGSGHVRVGAIERFHEEASGRGTCLYLTSGAVIHVLMDYADVEEYILDECRKWQSRVE